MKTAKIKELKRSAIFMTLKDFEKYGEENEKYLRVRGEYFRECKKYYTERPYYDAIGNGKLFSGNTIVVVIDEKSIFTNI